MKNARDGISENPNLKIFGGECPPPPPTPAGLGCLRRANFTSPAYRYLVAYEINALGWKKRLGLEGVGGGGVHFKNCYCQAGVQFLYVIIFWGGGMKSWYTTLFWHPNPPPPRPTPWDVINERSLNFSVIILFLEEIWGDSKENRTRWYYLVSCKLCQSVTEQNGFLPVINGCKRLLFYSIQLLMALFIMAENETEFVARIPGSMRQNVCQL